MEHYSTFFFEDIVWNPHARKIVLRYSLDKSVSFEETLILPDLPYVDLEGRKAEIDQALFMLHLIGGISYFKTCCPRAITINSGTITAREAAWWNDVYTRGLGEFFYQNQIDFRGLVKFPALEEKRAPTNTMKKLSVKNPYKRMLVPIGGGKDSLVTVELLKKSGANLTLFRLGDHPLITELAHRTGLPLLSVKRSISPTLFDLNAEGALNGHVPITAYLSVLTILMSVLYDFDAVVMSNEWSANTGNVQYLDTEVNHQWSKSLEFEKMFRSYLKDTVGTTVDYFSLLRPMSELKIAELFSKMPQYFDSATSCNTNWRILKDTPSDRWCRKCPKCAFVFAIFAAFLSEKEVTTMFGGNLFEDEGLLPLYRELLGTEAFKPFECVGTPDETRAAFVLIQKGKKFSKTPVMKMFEKEVQKEIKDEDALVAEALKLKTQHCIPDTLKNLI